MEIMRQRRGVKLYEQPKPMKLMCCKLLPFNANLTIGIDQKDAESNQACLNRAILCMVKRSGCSYERPRDQFEPGGG